MFHLINVNDINPIIRKTGIQIKSLSPTPLRIILDYELIYCHRGSLTVDYEKDSYRIQAGEIAVIPPNELHRFITDHQLEAYWVHFDFVQYPYQDKLSSLVEASNQINSCTNFSTFSIPRPHIKFHPNSILPSSYKVVDSTNTLSIFKALQQLNKARHFDWQLHCKQLLLKIIIEMITHLQPESQDILPENGLILLIEQYIKNNIYKRLSVSEIGRHFHYHPDTITRIFKSHHGHTLSWFIQHYKIQASKKLLTDTSYSIETISELFGFTDRTYYSKVFKKVEGISPARYRKELLT